MRQTLSISLPPALKKEIEQIVQSGMYSSSSELIRDALREFKNQALVKELKISQREAKRGKLYELLSLKDLRD